MICRNSKKDIVKIFPPFFKDSRHLEGMMEYLARIRLTKTIEENFLEQMGRCFGCGKYCY